VPEQRAQTPFILGEGFFECFHGEHGVDDRPKKLFQVFEAAAQQRW
jgi:hypothetical protein